MQIILIPGLMNDGWVWRQQIGPLSRFGPLTIAHNDGCDSLGSMAERILSVNQGHIAVAGHSMGGRVALEVVARAPDRVAKLALLDTGAGGPTEGEASGRIKLADLGRSEGMAAVAREWLPPMLAPANRNNQALVHGITEMLERCSAESFAAQQKALINRPDRTALLAAITCPTLVATGSEDSWASPIQHRDMANEIPDATLRIVQGSGHMLPVEEPEMLAALLIEWLRD